MDTPPQPEENTRSGSGNEKREKELLKMTTSAISAHPRSGGASATLSDCRDGNLLGGCVTDCVRKH